MARLSDHDIERINRATDLLALVRSRGIEMKRHGSRDFAGRCPFHDDAETADFIVSPAEGSYHCTACGAAGNAIQFVARFDGVSLRHAYELLADGGKAAFENTHSRPRKKTTVPTLPCPLDVEADDATLLSQVCDYYHRRLSQSKPALDYLASRGLDDQALVRRFRIGFADRTLGLRLPDKRRKQGAALRSRLQQLGVFREHSGHEHFNGAVVVPIVSRSDEPAAPIVNLYGRKITAKLRKGTAAHLYLPGPHRGIFNAQALEAPEIILCEGILDALTFIRHGIEAATCIYGTEGFTEELFEAIKAANLDAVRIAYDADDDGEQAARRDAAKLQAIGVACYRVRLPHGEDVNTYGNLSLQADAAERLARAVRSARWLGATDGVACVAAAGVAAKSEAPDNPPTTRKAKPQSSGTAAAVALVASGEHHQLALGECGPQQRNYRVAGLINNSGLNALKVTLRLWHAERFHIDQVDLCRDIDRRRFSERAGHECRLEADLIKRDLGKLLLACERVQDARLRDDPEAGEATAVSMADDERGAAEQLLRSPELIQRLVASFDAAGVVGEQTNLLAAYLAATSRLLARPLAVIIQSSSAAGKTTLMEAVLSFFPGEDQIKYSAMTGQSLYYLGEKSLRHKILAIVEEEGAHKAGYALKLLQSEGELTIASTGKDATTGRMKTEEYHVEGPVAIVLTTTSIDIDEELMNRCLVLSVDESQQQTLAIHRLQRRARTLEGLRLKKRRAGILTLLQNAQRLLDPVAIINPYANELTFTAERTRTRRDHEKYLTLIEAVTLLHQHQRLIQQDALAGPHLKATLGDIAVANAIAPEVLGRSLDELPPQTRRLLETIKRMVAECCDTRAIDQDKCHFTRRQVREYLGWSEFQVRTHIHKLEHLEYLARRRGRQGVGCVYELLIDCRQPRQIAHVGLIDIDRLRRRQQPDP